MYNKYYLLIYIRTNNLISKQIVSQKNCQQNKNWS